MTEKVYQTLLKVPFLIIRSESSLNPHLLKRFNLVRLEKKKKKKKRRELEKKENLPFFSWG